MSNRPNKRSVADQTTDHTPFTIADAADRLGLSSEAIRMRLKRGTLNGAKVDGRWVVYLGTHEQATEQQPTTDHTPTEHDQTALVAAKDETINAQREEIAFLRHAIEQQRRDQTAERERFDVIHREALHRIEALTAGPDESEGDGIATMPLTASPTATGATESAAMTQNTLIEPSHLTAWIRRLFGRA
jgi:predicted ArsR family transcriptional regulator